jgi:hypothetical protein
MIIESKVVMTRLHPLRLPKKKATADKTESAGDEEVISAGSPG